MRLRNTLKYFDILIIAIICIFAYKLIDNYTFFFDTLGAIISVVAPFLYACVIAYALNPIMEIFEKKLRLTRTISVVCTYLLIAVVIVLISIYIVPSIYGSVMTLIGNIPTYANKTQEWVDMILKNEKLYDFINQVGLTDTIYSFSSKAGDFLINGLQNSITSIISIASNLVKIGFGFLISIYLLFDKEKIISGVKTLIYIVLKKKRADIIVKWLKTYDDMIGKYIGIKAIDSSIIGFMALIGLIVIGAPYAIIIAIIVGITNMIPYFGPLVGEIIGFIFGLFVSPSMAFIIFIFLFALQQFDAWILDPKLIGKKVGVQPYLIIIAVTIGGGFFGIVGMLLASPTIATIKLCYGVVINSYLDKNPSLKDAIQNTKTESISSQKLKEMPEDYDKPKKFKISLFRKSDCDFKFLNNKNKVDESKNLSKDIDNDF